MGDLAELSGTTYQYACGSGFTVKGSTDAYSGSGCTAKTACCAANEACGAATCPTGYTAKTSAASTACAGLTCDFTSGGDKATCCDAVAAEPSPSPSAVSEPSPAAADTLPESSASGDAISLI